jgi:predicted DNA-binding transcriptional regulator YafY
LKQRASASLQRRSRGEREGIDPHRELSDDLKGGVWYLVADGDDGVRACRVSRLSAVRVREEEAVRPPGFGLPSFWSRWLAEFEASRPQVKVRVRIHRTAVPELERVLAPRDRQAIATVPPPSDDDGEWLTMTVPFERPEHALQDVLGFGERVEVLGPPALRERVAASPRTVAALYASTAPTGSLTL